VAFWRVKVERLVIDELWVTVEEDTRDRALAIARHHKHWHEADILARTHQELVPVEAEQIGGYDEEPDAMQAWHERRETDTKGDC
jgi:hypothetical protein